MSQSLCPNILFIMSDQHRADAAGPLSRGFETPALNTIAADGTHFTNCYTNSPQCIPARAAMHFGLYPHQSGIVSNNTGFLKDTGRMTWVRRLHDAGYHNAVFGKTHLLHSRDLIASEGKMRALGFDTVCEVHGPRQSMHTRSHMTDHWKQLGLIEAYREDIKGREISANRVRPSPLGYDNYYDTYVARKAREFLERYDANRPFFCWLSFPGPHEPYDTPEPYASMFPPGTMQPAIERPKKIGGAPCLLHDLLSHPCAENPGLTTAEIAALRANYAGGVRLIDDLIGGIIDLLKKQGRYDDTVILFTSDHGEMNGDWGLLRKKVFLDGSARVPLIVKPVANNDIPRARSCDALVELMDVGPTLLSLAGVDEPAGLGGRTFAPHVTGAEGPHRNYILSQFGDDRMILSNAWKLVLNSQGAPSLLFDRSSDPDEVNNLVGEVPVESLFPSLSFDDYCEPNA